MNTIIYEFKAEEYAVLVLDEIKTPKTYRSYLIDGKYYNIIPVYDATNCIAVESSESFIGKTVEFK